MATDSMLVVLEDVVKEYKIGGQSVRALDGVNLEAGRGLMVAIVGPSGSGKSTLLNVLGAMDRPTSGRAVVEGVDLGRLGGKDLTDHRRTKVGFVFQSFNLIPNLSALENVMLPMEFAGVPADERKKRAMDLLERVGMSHRVGHTPARLSGGEQQRVAIARALANDPAIILADEPTGNLDSKTGREVIGLLRELARSRAKTVMVVTHDEAIEAVADRAVHIRDGRIAEKTALSRQGQDEDGRSNGRSSS